MLSSCVLSLPAAPCCRRVPCGRLFSVRRVVLQNYPVLFLAPQMGRPPEQPRRAPRGRSSRDIRSRQLPEPHQRECMRRRMPPQSSAQGTACSKSHDRSRTFHCGTLGRPRSRETCGGLVSRYLPGLKQRRRRVLLDRDELAVFELHPHDPRPPALDHSSRAPKPPPDHEEPAARGEPGLQPRAARR